MQAKSLLVSTIVMFVLAAILASVIYASIPKQHYTPSTATTQPITTKPQKLSLRDYLLNELQHHMTVVLTISKNGEVVYRKIGDPVSVNWLKFVLNVFFACFYKGDCRQTFTLTDGTTEQYADFEYNGLSIPVLAVGSGTGTASAYDYKLFNEILSAELDSNHIFVTDTGSKYIASFVYTFIFESAADITECGFKLKIKAFSAGESEYYDARTVYLLVFHDTFNAIHVNVGDSITVNYTIIVDYNKPPFLKVFWQWILRYGFGALPLQPDVAFDTGIDYASSAYVFEYMYFSYVTTDIPWSPTALSPTADASNKWMPYKRFAVLNETCAGLNMWLVQGDMTKRTAYGIAIYIYTDTSAGSDRTPQYVPIAYIRFDNAPISVDITKWFNTTLILCLR